MCFETMLLLKENYELCILVIDFRRLTPNLLHEWNKTLVNNADTDKFCLFYANGKLCKMCRARRGKGACRIIASLGAQDVNLAQKAYYNGHYGFHGLKVQNMLQADGMRYTFADSLHCVDSILLHKSNLIKMISHLRVGTVDQKVPKVVLDKTYGRHSIK